MAKLLGVVTIALFVPAALISADPQDGQGAEKDKTKRQRLIGQYQITGGEKDGAPIPEDRLKDNTVAITEDTFAVVDRDSKELYSAKYTLKRRAGEGGVWEIDFESKAPREGEKAVGLIKRESRQLVLIYATGETRPEGFEKTTQGQHLFKLTRLDKKGRPKEPPEQAGGSGT